MVGLPGTIGSKGTPSVASRTQTLIGQCENLAQGGRAFVQQIQKMASMGLLDRRKMVDYVRIVSLFNQATGKDTSHGLLDLVYHLLTCMSAGEDGGSSLSQIELLHTIGGGIGEIGGKGVRAVPGSSAATPPELDDLACYIISRGGTGAESVFCSEAMKQLFISTDELTCTLKETGLTSVSVWASFTTPEGLATLHRAAAAVLLQRDTSQVEVQVECVTRTDLLVACTGTLTFHVSEKGESSLVLCLAVKQDASPRAVGAPAKPRSDALLPAGEKSPPSSQRRSSSRRSTHAAERQAVLASRREQALQQQAKEQLQQQQQRHERASKRRRLPPTEAAPVSPSSASPLHASSSSVCSTSSAASSTSTASSASLPASLAMPPATGTSSFSYRPPPHRPFPSSMRRKTSFPVSWSARGPLLPAGLLRLMDSGAAPEPLPMGLLPAGKEGFDASVDGERGRMEQGEQDGLSQGMVLARGLPEGVNYGRGGGEIFTLNRHESGRGGMAATAPETSSRTTAMEEEKVPHANEGEEEDDGLWAWADSIWEGAAPSLELGTDLAVSGAVGEGPGVSDVEDPSLWLMLDEGAME